jgi:mitochondrial fission protein ELM1
VTTSRRTSKEIENIIRSKLAKQPNCKLLLIANEKNIEGAVEAILGLSKLCIISQESISMISEAASSGCYTIVFKDSLYRNKRHNEFLQNLNRNNFIKIADASTVYKTACDFFKNRFTQNILDDSSKIEGAIGTLL